MTILEQQLASGQQVCADQQAHVPLLEIESMLTNANQTVLNVTALEQQLDGAERICADQQAQLSTLESQLADANQTAFRATAHVQQHAGAQQICADQAHQVQQLEDANSMLIACAALRAICLKVSWLLAHMTSLNTLGIISTTHRHVSKVL